MSKNSSSEIQKVVNILSNVDKLLDEIKANVEQENVKLRELGKQSAERARYRVISQVKDNIQNTLDETKHEADIEANRIIAESEKRIKELTKNDTRFQEALKIVSKEVLGEECAI